MVWMGFTCILQTNTFLVGRYWDFKCRKVTKLVISHTKDSELFLLLYHGAHHFTMILKKKLKEKF